MSVKQIKKDKTNLDGSSESDEQINDKQDQSASSQSEDS